MDEPIEVPRVPTRPKVNVTGLLRELRVGDTIRFPLGANYGSIRTLATVLGIKINLKMLDSSEIEVTRRA